MAGLFNWLFSLINPPHQPGYVEGDEIFPLHVLDDTPTNRSFTPSWTLRFNEVLDAEKLNDSLTRLLEIGDWRKLGGRIRLKKDGKLELHVPKKFTPERPAVRFSHVVFEIGIDEHSLASKLPKPSSQLSVHADPEDFRPLTLNPGTPMSIEDYLAGDHPVLSLHVVSFSNATLVCITWSHVVTDGLGRHALVTAWSQVLAGRESEVRPFLGARKDVLDEIVAETDVPEEPHVLEKNKLGGLRMLIFAVRFAWGLLVRPKVESRVIFLPASYISSLRERAEHDLEDGKAGDTTFVSDGDIISAWTTRHLARAARPSSVVVASAAEMRGRLPKLAKAAGVYIQNMAMATFTILSSNEAIQMPFGRLALRFRESIASQLTEPQVRTFLKKMRSGKPTLFARPDSSLFVISNWSKSRYFEAIDFSPAVVRAGSPPCTGDWPNRPGRIVYTHNHSLKPSTAGRNVFIIQGKDSDKNYWLIGILPPDYWTAIIEAVEREKADGWPPVP